MDNAAYHVEGENTVLENWLWTRHGIFLLLLPPRCPELNPTEQVWKMLVLRLKTYPLYFIHQVNAHGTVVAACEILTHLTHAEVVGMYKHCGIIVD